MTDTATTPDSAVEVETTVGEPSGEPLSVPVSFLYKGVPFSRRVNAALDDSGAYDAAATAQRVEAHARTMKYRVDAGILTAPTPEAETDAPPAVAPTTTE